MKKLIFAIIGTFILCPVFSFANDDIKTYPVKGIFVSKNVNSDDFMNLYSNKSVKDNFISSFLKEYKSKFNISVDEITDKTKYKTLVSYISIPRVSKYIEKKPNGNVIYLPLTMSLSFVNIITGEIIYSTSATEYGIVQNDDYKSICEEYIKNYKKTLFNVLNKAKENFHPFEIPVNIIDNYKNVFILNKGIEKGISEGDELFDENSNQLSVIYSTMEYSIAKNEFGASIAPETTFIKQVNNGGISQIKKAKVLLINDIGNEMLYDLLMTSLGKDSKINLITVNSTFNSMRNTVFSLNNLSTLEQNQLQREMPDYFLYVNFTEPVKANFLLDKSGLYNTYYEMMATATIFDKTGKVVFSQYADDKTEARRNNSEYGALEKDVIEILYKNLISKLADKINSQIQFKDFEFKIQKIGKNEIILADNQGILSVGNSINLYKKIKIENSEYLIPFYNYKVIETKNGQAICTLDFPYIDNTDSVTKSYIAKSTMIVSKNGFSFYNIDTEKMNLEDSEIILNSSEDIILPVIGTNLKKPLAINKEVLENKISIINKSGIFKKDLIISENNSKLVIKPVYKINLKKHKIKGYTQINTYNLIVGLYIYNDTKLINQKLITQDVTIVIPLKHYEKLLDYELQKAVYNLLEYISLSIK